MKNGFTLVELLAVIALLAILSIIAVPSVIELYTRSKKNIFLTEVKGIYKKANETYISNTVKDKDTYIFNSEDDSTKLDMTNRPIKYCIIIDKTGNVEFMNASDGKYVITIDRNQSIGELDVDSVEEGNLDDFTCGQIIN